MESITPIDQIMKIAINNGNIVAMIVQKMKMTMQNKTNIIINIKMKALEIIINKGSFMIIRFKKENNLTIGKRKILILLMNLRNGMKRSILIN